MESRDRELRVVDVDGGSGVREGAGGQKNGLRPMWMWTQTRVCTGARHRALGFR